RGEEPGGLEDVVDATALPRQLGRISHRQDARAPPVDREPVAGGDDFRGLPVEPEPALHGVVAKQVREVVGRDHVVHGDHLEGRFRGEAVDESTDASEAVDADADCHDEIPPYLTGAARWPKNHRFTTSTVAR